MHDTLELLNARPIGNVALRCKTSTDDQILRFGGASVCSVDMPAALIGVELGFGDDTLESGVGFDVQDLVTGVEVIAEIVVVGIIVRPIVSVYRQQYFESEGLRYHHTPS